MFDLFNTPESEAGEVDDRAVAEYCNGLVSEFANSPQGAAVVERYGQVGWTPNFLDFAFNYIGVTPPEMSPDDVRYIIFTLFPKKVSTEPESAAEIIFELRSLFQFLLSNYRLPNAEAILADFDENAAGNLERELGDSRNFGPAKSFVMMGREAGYDMTSQEGINEFMNVYNAAQLAAREAEDSQRSRMPPEPPRAKSPPKPKMPVLSADARKKREKLRRQKLRKRKRR